MERLVTLAENLNINMLLDSIESLLAATGGMQDIMRAIRTKDSAGIVRAATGALKKIGVPDRFLGNLDKKSAEESDRYRKVGNLLYLKKDYKAAIVCYNKALAYAPPNSLEVKLAYSNISAVMLAIEAYKACQMNIEAAQELDCPEFLRAKLEKRMNDANKYIDEDIRRDEMIRSDEYMLSYAKFDVIRNSDIPCASNDVYVDNGKVKAAKVIKSGTMVAFERAFVSFQDEINEYTSCYYCHKMSFFFIPCEGCCKALFCSKKCREKCFEDYHRIECHIAGYMYYESSDINQHLNKLATRAAVKMSLKLSWEELRVASLEMGMKLLKKSTVQAAYDSNSPVSMLCYYDRVDVPSEVIMNRSLVCAMTVHWLSTVPGYLPQEEKEREQAIDTLSRITLHLFTTFMQQISIAGSATDYKSDDKTRSADEVQRNVGWFSFASKLAHSCEPNLLVVGFNDHVALVALQRIKKGDPLTISYVEHFYDMNMLPCPKNSYIRQKLIFKFMEYTCHCRVCLGEWNSSSQLEAKLTNRQQEAYHEYRTAMYGGSFKQRMKAISLALDELTECINTSQHRSVYVDFKKTLSSCQHATDLNKTYGCDQTYTLHPFHDINDYM